VEIKVLLFLIKQKGKIIMKFGCSTESRSTNVNIVQWSFVPGVGVGPLRFGMTREQVATVMSKWVTKFGLSEDFKPKMFKKTKTSTNDTEDWHVMHLYYSSADKLEAIEVWGTRGFSISCPIITSKNMDVKLFTVIPTNMNTVIQGLVRFSPSISLDVGDGAIIVKPLSMAVTFDDTYAGVDSCLFGAKGYFK
jgi:hypothetical protein